MLKSCAEVPRAWRAGNWVSARLVCEQTLPSEISINSNSGVDQAYHRLHHIQLISMRVRVEDHSSLLDFPLKTSINDKVHWRFDDVFPEHVVAVGLNCVLRTRRSVPDDDLVVLTDTQNMRRRCYMGRTCNPPAR